MLSEKHYIYLSCYLFNPPAGERLFIEHTLYSMSLTKMDEISTGFNLQVLAVMCDISTSSNHFITIYLDKSFRRDDCCVIVT